MAPKAGKARETIVMVQSILLLLHAQSLWQPFWESIDGRGKWTWVLSACCSTLRKFFLTSMSARLTKALVQDVWGRFQPDTTSHFLLSLSDVLLGGPRFLHRSQPSEVRRNLHKERHYDGTGIIAVPEKIMQKRITRYERMTMQGCDELFFAMGKMDAETYELFRMRGLGSALRHLDPATEAAYDL